MSHFALRALIAFAVTAVSAAPAALADYSDEPPAAIALFSERNYYGEVRDVFDPFTTLKDLGFNDHARSVAVFAGQWELCEHWNFTGRCVFIREDVSDLGWFGLSGRVTSVRPVFEYTEAQHGLMFSRDKYGYIRYAHNETHGYDIWNYGYASSWGISVSHYGYSSDYWRYGYYNPAWGYDPYGFAWSPRGTIRYTYTYRRHPRPSVINPYWIGWDFRRPEWRRGHWSWRDEHRDRDSWRDGHRDDDDRWGRGGRDWRPGNGDGRGGGRRGADDRDGDGPQAGASSSGALTTPIPTDPRTGGRGREGRDWRPDDRRAGDTDRPRTGRVGSADVITSVPGDLFPGRDGWPGNRDGEGVRPGRSPAGTVTPPAPDGPRIGREGRAGPGGDGASVMTPQTGTARSWGGAGDNDGLAGGPSTDGWRGRGRGGDNVDARDTGRGRGERPRDGGD